jgi:tetratricopeptide (TPR) repeat protein
MKKLYEEISVLKEVIKNGDFGEARISCEKLLRDNQTSAELNFLLGFVYNKLHLDSRAEELLQSTIYIDPNYYDALVELSLLYEKMGQHDKASNFRERAFRLSNKISK